jgi:hypothetical protein
MIGTTVEEVAEELQLVTEKWLFDLGYIAAAQECQRDGENRRIPLRSQTVWRSSE